MGYSSKLRARLVLGHYQQVSCFVTIKGNYYSSPAVLIISYNPKSYRAYSHTTIMHCKSLILLK